MYDYRNLEHVSDYEFAECLNLAFSDYYIPIRLTEEELPHFFKASGVDKKLSFGAFSGRQMVGFILNSCNIYYGQKAVFDVGTGVIPEHRGKKVFTNLLAFAERELKFQGIKRYYLEVLQQNDRAVSLYKRQGFSIVREFSVLRACDLSEKTACANVQYAEYSNFDFQKAGQCYFLSPSYEHSTNVLKLNPDFYQIAYTDHDGVSAFCVFSKRNGQILQLGYRNIQDLQQIIQSLLSTFHELTAKNIDVKEAAVLEMLYSVGFQQVVKQFEMVKELYLP